MSNTESTCVISIKKIPYPMVFNGDKRCLIIKWYVLIATRWRGCLVHYMSQLRVIKIGFYPYYTQTRCKVGFTLKTPNEDFQKLPGMGWVLIVRNYLRWPPFLQKNIPKHKCQNMIMYLIKRTIYTSCSIHYSNKFTVMLQSTRFFLSSTNSKFILSLRQMLIISAQVFS